MKALFLALLLLGSVALADSLDQDLQVLDKVAGNGSHQRTTYSETLDVAALVTKVHSEGVQWGRCYSPKIIAYSEQMNARAIAERHQASVHDVLTLLKDEYEYNEGDFAELAEIQDALLRILTATENKLVIYSGYNSESFDAPDACRSYKFLVYRDDGVLVSLDFNRVD